MDFTAHEYAVQVVNGEIIACKQIINACKRYLNDLETGDERGLYPSMKMRQK